MGFIFIQDVPTDADLRDVFTVFDKDRSGFASRGVRIGNWNHKITLLHICSSEIKTVMSNLGVHFTDEEIQEMMIEVKILFIISNLHISI